ncbi:MAG: VacJ family lipoprotein [Proteobacteria bacterium]|nr:VacJ family lipoprotein [Pseudomonadota bacterium]
MTNGEESTRSGIFRKFRRVAFVLAAFAVLAGCATAPEDDPEAMAEFNKINDPAEPFNRDVFEFNRGLDTIILKPVTGVYRSVAPEVVRDGVHNFLNNLRTPVILANDVLQGEFLRARDTLVRFLINSTIGVLGFSDQATGLGFEFHNEDFGQTLATWGVSEGPYLMLPILGPSNPRDAVGKVVDFFFDPINYWAANTDRQYVTISRTVISGIDARDQIWDILNDLERSSIDFYAAIRSLYRQSRADGIRNGAGQEDQPTPGFGGSFEIAAPDSPAEKDIPK